jgi:hypothetical protein
MTDLTSVWSYVLTFGPYFWGIRSHKYGQGKGLFVRRFNCGRPKKISLTKHLGVLPGASYGIYEAPHGVLGLRMESWS